MKTKTCNICNELKRVKIIAIDNQRLSFCHPCGDKAGICEKRGYRKGTTLNSLIGKNIFIWIDGTWCDEEHIEEYTYMSDDYINRVVSLYLEDNKIAEIVEAARDPWSEEVALKLLNMKN